MKRGYISKVRKIKGIFTDCLYETNPKKIMRNAVIIWVVSPGFGNLSAPVYIFWSVGYNFKRRFIDNNIRANPGNLEKKFS